MIAAGIGVALAAAAANAVSVVLQAAEARRAPDQEGMHAALLARLAHRPRWLAGTALQILAWPLQVLALAFAPLAIVQPTLATSQLVLLGIARFKLHQRIGRHEVLSALGIVVGLAAVVEVAPRQSIVDAGVGHLAPPMATVGVAALIAYGIGRAHHAARPSLIIGAGLAYAWVDFVNKLLADNLSGGRYALAAVWLVCTLGFGAVAFLEETTALQHSPAVTVAPVIGAIKVPLPVLMSLWAGVGSSAPTVGQIGVLLFGLALVAAGGAGLGRSSVVARVASGISAEPAPTGSRSRPSPPPGGQRSNQAVTEAPQGDRNRG